MSHIDFLAAFAKAQALGSVEQLLTDHARRHSFQINSRERAKAVIATLEKELQLTDWRGRRVLDVGCAYGAFTIELAKLGAEPIGIDLNSKWLRLAQINAQGEVDVPFIRSDAASRGARQFLQTYAPFDIVLINDVFEHIYDTAGLLSNLRALMRSSGLVYFKVPNGRATRSVLLEGHKSIFGISLLAPDYWPKFVKAPFQIYYRRWEYFAGLFNQYGFKNLKILNVNTDPTLEATRKHILNDVDKIRRHLQLQNFQNADQFRTVRDACQQYFLEVTDDLEAMNWAALFFKYRVTFWEGTIEAPDK